MALIDDWFNNNEYSIPSEREGSDFDHWSYNPDYTIISCHYWNRDVLKIDTTTGCYTWH